MRAALPMNSKLQGLIICISVNDDFFEDCAEDHLLKRGRTATTLPDFSKVLTHRTNFCFLFGGQRISLSVEAGKPLLGCLDLDQLFVPASLQLACCQAIPGFPSVIFFKGLLAD